MQGVDLLFHAASQSAYWRHPELVLKTTVEGTQNILRAALAVGVRRVVFTSSYAAMGVPAEGELLTEDNSFDLEPETFLYGYAKRQAEIEALKFVAQGLDVVIVNPTVVLGPGDINRISGSLVIEAARGWGFFWMEGGINAVHIDDVVAGHLAAAEHGRVGERYLLGGENITHHKAFDALADIVGRRRPWLKIPAWSLELAARTVAGLSPLVKLPFNSDHLRMSRHHLFCDLSKAQIELGLTHTKSFRQAAQDAYEWYRQQGMI